MILNKKSILIYFSFLLFLSNILLGSLSAHIFKSNLMNVIILLMSILVLTYTINGSKKGKNVHYYILILTIVFVFFIFFRNHNLSASGLTNIVYICVGIFFMYLLSHDTKWIALFYNVMLIYSLLHVLVTILSYAFPDIASLIVTKNLSGDVLSNALAQLSQGKIVGFSDTYSLNATYVSYAFGISSIRTIYYQGRKKYLYSIFCIASFLSLIFIGKRAHIVFSILSIVIVWIFSERDKLGKRLMNSFIFIIIAALIIITFLPILSGRLILFERFTDLQDLSTLGGRRELYAEALRIFKSSPLIGVGWAGYPDIVQYTVGRLYPPQFARMQAHNIYLQLLAETGIIGTIFFYFIFSFPLKRGFTILKYDIGITNKINMTISMFFQLFFLIYGLTGNSLYDKPLYVPYLMSVTVLLSLNQRYRKVH